MKSLEFRVTARPPGLLFIVLAFLYSKPESEPVEAMADCLKVASGRWIGVSQRIAGGS